MQRWKESKGRNPVFDDNFRSFFEGGKKKDNIKKNIVTYSSLLNSFKKCTKTVRVRGVSLETVSISDVHDDVKEKSGKDTIIYPGEDLTSAWPSLQILRCDYTEREDKVCAMPWACFTGDIDVVTQLISFSSYVDRQMPNGNTLMMEAVAGQTKAGSQCIQLLLKAGARTNLENEQGHTLLTAAAAVGDLTVLRLITSGRHVHINHKTNRGSTAVTLAAVGQHKDVVRHLVMECGADLLTEDWHWMTPVCWAQVQNADLAGYLCLHLGCIGKLEPFVMRRIEIIRHIVLRNTHDSNYCTQILKKTEDIVPLLLIYDLLHVLLMLKPSRQLIVMSGIINSISTVEVWEDMIGVDDRLDIAIRQILPWFVALSCGMLYNEGYILEQFIASGGADRLIETVDNTLIESKDKDGRICLQCMLAPILAFEQGREWLVATGFKYANVLEHCVDSDNVLEDGREAIIACILSLLTVMFEHYDLKKNQKFFDESLLNELFPDPPMTMYEKLTETIAYFAEIKEKAKAALADQNLQVVISQKEEDTKKGPAMQRGTPRKLKKKAKREIKRNEKLIASALKEEELNRKVYDSFLPNSDSSEILPNGVKDFSCIAPPSNFPKVNDYPNNFNQRDLKSTEVNSEVENNHNAGKSCQQQNSNKNPLIVERPSYSYIVKQQQEDTASMLISPKQLELSRSMLFPSADGRVIRHSTPNKKDSHDKKASPSLAFGSLSQKLVSGSTLSPLSAHGSWSSPMLLGKITAMRLPTSSARCKLEFPKSADNSITAHKVDDLEAGTVEVKAGASMKEINWISQSSRWKSLFQSLIALPCDKRQRIGSIQFSFSNETLIIGTGSKGTTVSIGLRDDGMEVAVKRTPKGFMESIGNELKNPRVPNVVQKYPNYYVEDESFGYLAVELCEYTLEDYIHKLKEAGTMQEHALHLSWQIIHGLNILHSAKILHKDLKPHNVLVDTHGNVRLADFGLGYYVGDSSTNHLEISDGQYCWQSSEALGNVHEAGQKKTESTKSDIQVAGMIIFYIMSGGQHPYGKTFDEVEQNILKGMPYLVDVNDEMLVNLMSWMLHPDTNSRKSAEECMAHPIFWEESKRFAFLLKVSQQTEFRKTTRIPNARDVINNMGTSLQMKDWRTQLDEFAPVRDVEMDSYSSNLSDLLRFMVYVKKTFSNLLSAAEIHKFIGDLAEYFIGKFIRVFIIVYEVIRESSLRNSISLTEYFMTENYITEN